MHKTQKKLNIIGYETLKLLKFIAGEKCSWIFAQKKKQIEKKNVKHPEDKSSLAKKWKFLFYLNWTSYQILLTVNLLTTNSMFVI